MRDAIILFLFEFQFPSVEAESFPNEWPGESTDNTGLPDHSTALPFYALKGLSQLSASKNTKQRVNREREASQGYSKEYF